MVDAVRCAVEMQRGMAERNDPIPQDERIDFRVGINLGDVIADGEDIFGDGVNVAARLEALAEPGGICVSRVVRDQVRDRLDFAFEDLGAQQVKNIARPVRVYALRREPAPALTLAAAATIPRTAAAPRLSIVVLPFADLSNDREQQYFADGITEDLTTDLSRIAHSFVISRNTAFTYRNKPIDTRQIGRELGVRYVLEGSLRKSGNRIRVTAQLVEADTGKHIWANRYDRDLADIFAVQDEITEAVTIAIAPAIADAEQQRAMRKPPGSLDAWAAYQRGLWHLGKFGAEDNTLAQRFFQQTIDLDPNFSGGYAGLAIAKRRGVQRQGLLESHGVLELARRAVLLDPNDAEAHTRLGFMLSGQGDHDGALAEVQSALAISPNLANAHAVLGQILLCTGRPKEDG